MNTRELMGRAAVAAVGATMLVGVAGAAVADDDYGSDDVEVNVDIAQIDEPGILAMTVAGDATPLTETDSGVPTVRQFTGTLPTVTVTDTRVFPDRIDPAAFWYVLGTASDFTGDAGQAALPAGHLGWAPALVEGTDPGEVAAGDQVDTVMDTGVDAVGLVDQELLAISAGSQEVNPTGSWSVDADLFLKTPLTVASGSYSSTLTLSLFEFTG